LDLGDVHYFPLESVYGVIEVKSNLDSVNTIQDALDGSWPVQGPFEQTKGFWGCGGIGFGILFAYTASLQWESLLGAIANWQRTQHPSRGRMP